MSGGESGTYPQDWPAYNSAQTSEKDTFMALLADLCAGIAQPERQPPPPPVPDGPACLWRTWCIRER